MVYQSILLEFLNHRVACVLARIFVVYSRALQVHWWHGLIRAKQFVHGEIGKADVYRRFRVVDVVEQLVFSVSSLCCNPAVQPQTVWVTVRVIIKMVRGVRPVTQQCHEEQAKHERGRWREIQEHATGHDDAPDWQTEDDGASGAVAVRARAQPANRVLLLVVTDVVHAIQNPGAGTVEEPMVPVKGQRQCIVVDHKQRK